MRKVKSNWHVYPACKNWLNLSFRGQLEIKILIVRHISNTTCFIWIEKIKLEPAIIWKLVTCQLITSKILGLDGSTPEPAIRSGDTGQWDPGTQRGKVIDSSLASKSSAPSKTKCLTSPSLSRDAFHSTQNSGSFGWFIKWNGPFRFGPTGIFGTSWAAYHLTENFGNSGWKVNGKVTFRRFQPKIEEYVLR